MTNEAINLIKEELEKKAIPINELIELRETIDVHIKTLQDEMRASMITEFRKQAEDNGIPFEELVKSLTTAVVGHHKNSKANKNPPRYANPKDLNQTWSGHGKKPDWIKNLPDGITKEDCLIK